MAKPILTQEYLLLLFEYKNGELYWKERPRSHFKTDIICKRWNPKHVGKRAGCYSTDYASIRIDGVPYLLHRIIFLMHHGYLPEIIDHADGNTKNNRIENLRTATITENQQNQKLSCKNVSGYKCVYWFKPTKKWIAQIRCNGKKLHLGLFQNIEDAAKAAQKARIKYHGEFARHC